MILQETKILELLAKPKNGEKLQKALENQQELKHFSFGSTPDLVFNKIEDILTSDKLDTFKKVYKNHPQTLINQIVTHYKKIYEAHGRVFAFDFGKNVEAEVKFDLLREKIYNQVDDTKYWKDFAHELVFTEPNSVFLTGIGYESVPQIKRIKLENIHDVEATEAGIQYLIVKEVVKTETTKYNRFWIYDELNYYVYRESPNSKDGFEKEVVFSEDDEITYMEGPHGAKRCPAHFLYDVNETSDDFIVKKSPISDSIKDLYSYTILRTFYENYKYFSAFGKEIEAETRCEYTDHLLKVKCKNGWLESTEIDHPVTPKECPNCRKNKNVMGRIVKIPLNQQNNEEFLKSLPNMFTKIDADTTILEFHSEDIEKIKGEILSDCMGSGYGQSYRQQAVNEDQIKSNFEEQEANLNYFKQKIEAAWAYNLARAGEMFSDSFLGLSINLGNKFFLKSTDQLYAELELLYKGTSNFATIQNKQYEIVLTENKHNEAFLDRHKIISVLQPFSLLPQSYVAENRAMLMQTQPYMLRMYDNFGQVLALFEFTNGRVENFGINIESDDPEKNAKNLRIDKLISNFKEILNKQILSGYGEKTDIEQPEQGSDEKDRSVQR